MDQVALQGLGRFPVRQMHLVIHFLDLLNKLLAIIGIINKKVILFGPLLFLQGFQVAMTTVLVNMPLCRQIIYD
jgi:hypothetical protein